MGMNLDRLLQMYSSNNQNLAQTLGAMGRRGDSLVAHITPREAMMLKAQGGAGTRNPLTGLLEFYDADGGGNAADSGDPSGSGGATGESGADTSSSDPGDPGFGSSVDFGGSGFSGGGFGSDPNNSSGGSVGYALPVVAAMNTAPTAAPAGTAPAAANAMLTTPAGATAGIAPPSYGFELNRLMQMYGVRTPGALPYGGQASAQTDAARYAYDQKAYQDYAKEYQNRLMSGNVYNQAQFAPEPSKFAQQAQTPLAAPVYAPSNFADINAVYNQSLGRAPEPAGMQYWGNTGLTGDALKSAVGASPEATNYARNQISEIYNKYFGRPAEEAAFEYWGGKKLSGDDLMRAITSGAQNTDIDYFRQNYPNFSQLPTAVGTTTTPLIAPPGSDAGGIADTTGFVYGPDGSMYVSPAQARAAGVTNYTHNRPVANFARGGRVGYAEGGEVEEPTTERSSGAPLTPEGANRLAELLGQLRPTTNYGAQLAGAQQTARNETEAFSNMIRQMSERAESPASRAEMYFRLASAFGMPTRTGQFTENLALAGREMGEYTRGRREDEAERRALALRAQELRAAGARQDLASLQTLAGQESAERRAINSRIIEAQIRGNAPNARETRITDIMQTLGVGRPIAMGIADNIIQVVPGSAGEPPVLINRATGEIIPTRMGAAPSAPAAAPSAPPAEQPTAAPSAPAAGEIPAVNLRRQQAAAPTAPAPVMPGSVEDFYAGRRQRQVEQAGQTAEAEARGRVTAPSAPRQDFRYTDNFERVEPIPGSQAAQEREQRERAERVRREATERAGGTVIRAIDDIENTMRTAALPTTGFFGERLSNIGGTAANDIRANLRTVGSNIAFDQLNQMRQSSPTGAALGNVTNQELDLLKSVLGSVEQSQTEAQFRRNLTRLRDTFNEVIHYGLGNRPPVQIPGPGGRGTAEPPREGAAGARRPATEAAPAAPGEIRMPSGLILRPIQ